LVLLLGTLPGIVVSGQAADGDAAVDLVAAVGPHVVLMDLNMPGCDSTAATRRIVQRTRQAAPVAPEAPERPGPGLASEQRACGGRFRRARRGIERRPGPVRTYSTPWPRQVA